MSCEWFKRRLKCYSLPWNLVRIFFFLTHFSHFLVGTHPYSLLFLLPFFLWNINIFFLFNRKVSFCISFCWFLLPELLMFQLTEVLRYVQFTSWLIIQYEKLQYLPPQFSEKSSIHDLFFSSNPPVPWYPSGVSGLFSLQERKRCSRFAPRTLHCNTGCTIVLKSLSPEFRQLEYQHSRKQTSLFGGYFWIQECSSETFKS